MKLKEILDDIRSPRKKKVILDTDTYNEVDDQYALGYCYLSDRMDLACVCAAPFHNERSEDYADGMEKSYNEILKVLSLADPDYTTPVYRGSTQRITDTGSYIESPACDALIDIVKNSDEIVYVLAIGAVTNVASALLKDPSIKDNMCVIWLGAHQIDATTIMEFNLKQDLRAGQHLMNSGVPVLLCPAWNVTMELEARIGLFRTLYGHNPLCDYLAKITEDIYIEDNIGDDWYRIVWDIAAPAIIDCPECAEIEMITAPVFTDDYHHAFDSTRHGMLYLKKLDRDLVFEKTWETLKAGKQA